jgi:hypothetical protein
MNLKYIIVIILFAGITFMASAQNSGLSTMDLERSISESAPRDTVRYTVPGKVDLLVLSPDYDLLRKDSRLLNLFTDFQRDLELVQANIPENGNYRIIYRQNQILEIEEKAAMKRYSVGGNQARTANFNNEAILQGKGITAFIYFSDVQVLIDPNLLKAIENLTTQLPAQHRFLKVLKYEGNHLNVPPTLQEERTTGNLDMISLRIGVGANLIRNQFMTDLSGEIGLWFNRKGVLRNQIYVSNDLLFSLNPEQQAVFNNFTSLGFRRNFSSKPDKADWLGFEVGYLTRGGGDVFAANTFRMGFNWNVGNKITVSPQIYFNGAFQQVSPAIRIGFGL